MLIWANLFFLSRGLIASVEFHFCYLTAVNLSDSIYTCVRIPFLNTLCDLVIFGSIPLSDGSDCFLSMSFQGRLFFQSEYKGSGG